MTDGPAHTENANTGRRSRWLAVSMVLFLAACGLAVDDAERLARAERFHAQGNYQAEIIELKNVLKNDPVNLDARVRLGQASLAAGDPASAVKEFRRAVELGASVADFRQDYVDALLAVGDARGVLELSGQAEPRNGDEAARLAAASAEAHLLLSDPSGARAALDAVAGDASGVVEVRIAEAGVAMAEGRFAEAQAMLAELEPDAGDRVSYWERRASLALRAGEPAAAIAAYDRAIAEASRLTFGMQAFLLQAGLVDAYLAGGDTDHARTRAEAMLEAAPEHPLPNFLVARVAYQTGDMPTALSRVQAVLADHPRSSPANVLAGAAALQLGQMAQSEAYFQAAVESDPGNAAARKLLAQIRMQQGAANDAIEALVPAFEQGSVDPEVLGLVGAASVQAGDPDEAIALYRRLLERDPGNAEARLYLAAALVAVGRNDDAQAELETIVGGDDDAAAVRAELLSVFGHLRQGDMEKAKASADRLQGASTTPVATLVVLGRMFAAAGAPDDARRYLTEALNRDNGFAPARLALAEVDLLEGYLPAARRRYTNVLIDDPRNVEALMGLAALAEREDSQAAAIEWLDRARSADPAAAAPRVRLAEIHLEQGDLDAAETVLDEAEAIDPGDQQVQNLRGILLAGRGDLVAARDAFAAAAQNAPQLAGPRFNLARAEIALGNRTAAIAALNEAVRVDPGYLNARVLLAELAIARGELDDAQAMLEQVRALAPESDATAYLTADLSLARGESGEAVRQYRALLDKTGSLRAAMGLYQARRKAGDPQALEGLRAWVRNESGNDQALMVLAQEQQRSGALGDAIDTYEAAVETAPENAAALNNLAWLYQEAGDPRALATAERAYALMPESGPIADTLGWIYFKQNNRERALDYLTRAVELAPEEPEIRYHLAVVYAAGGDVVRARDELEIILADDVAVALHDEAQALLKSL